ncbi:MAG: hypothetical protein CBB97_19590 [Candidatus Endolissoclinum sp. TMED37]|nr:MAG: hypothetical protein CBB97_19590 [Candidatus Endolissoclinum sp. TMED37]
MYNSFYEQSPIPFTDHGLFAVNALSVYYCIFFTITYLFNFGKIKGIEIIRPKEVRGSSLKIIAAASVGLLATLVCVLVLVRHRDILSSLYFFRTEVNAYYYESIFVPYRLGSILVVLMSLVFALFIMTRSYLWFIMFLPLLLLNFSMGNRSTVFSIALLLLFCCALQRNRFMLFSAAGTLLLIPFMATYRYIYYDGSMRDILMLLGSESFSLYGHQIYTEHYASGLGSGVALIYKNIYNLFPSTIMYSLGVPYVETFMGAIRPMYQNQYQVNFGMGGPLLSESLYYGGYLLAVSTPLVIASCVWACMRFLYYRNAATLLYLLVFVTGIRSLFARLGFYENYLSDFYAVTVYGCVAMFLLWPYKVKVYE